ncbi:MAG: branched-chain amino acid ABC transporter permease [Deltaproteobacteria bacterium]|nr:branched-chain amino acid ABC transporter permease [Deltaproteobacteria bacterium]MBW2009790.1 branched-chain amino acid ABC transporter permease [Deltaproteobacteria bacterium]MBW2101234.1 branched-chain amino acid ABC transporter permease [Deltaproteobacteria bacterium]
MELFIQLLLNGVWAGSIYAILGVSWGLIFAATRTFHFAHGATFIVAAYFTFLFGNVLGAGLILASVMGILAAVLFGLGIEGFLYRGLRRAAATPLVIFIASLGSLIFFENLIAMFFGTDSKALTGFPVKVFKFGNVAFTNLHLIMLSCAFVLIGGLMLFLRRSRPGKAVRAVISNPEMAGVIGININRVYLLVHALGAILVGSAAVLVTLERGATPELGTWAILYSFIPVIIGGVGSMAGAGVAGFIIGFADSIGIWKIPSQWQLGIAFVVLLVVLIIRPNGLFGFSVYRGKI